MGTLYYVHEQSKHEKDNFYSFIPASTPRVPVGGRGSGEDRQSQRVAELEAQLAEAIGHSNEEV